MKCPIDIQKINFTIHLLDMLNSENLSKYKKMRIKKKLIVIKNKIKQNSLPYTDENMFISLNTFLSNMTLLTTNFEGILTDKR